MFTKAPGTAAGKAAAIALALAAAGLLAPATAQAAPYEATFSFDLAPGDGVAITPGDRLTARIVFDTDDALVTDGALAFPDDLGEGIDRVADFSFTSSLLSSGDLSAGMAFRSVFFDIASTGGSVFTAGAMLSAITSFAFYVEDAEGCALGLTPTMFGLGSDGAGNCRYAQYDAFGATVTLREAGVAVPTPEPAAAALFALGLAGLGLRRARRQPRAA